MENFELIILSFVALVFMLFGVAFVIIMRNKQHYCDISNYVMTAFGLNIFAAILINTILIMSIFQKSSVGIVLSALALFFSIASLVSLNVAYTTEAYNGSFNKWSKNYIIFDAITCAFLLGYGAIALI